MNYLVGRLSSLLSLSPSFKAAVPYLFDTRNGPMEDTVSMDQVGDGLRMIQEHYVLLLVHQLYLRSSSIRPSRLGTTALEHWE